MKCFALVGFGVSSSVRGSAAKGLDVCNRLRREARRSSRFCLRFPILPPPHALVRRGGRRRRQGRRTLVPSEDKGEIQTEMHFDLVGGGNNYLGIWEKNS